jgi:hypothetical protein
LYRIISGVDLLKNSLIDYDIEEKRTLS